MPVRAKLTRLAAVASVLLAALLSQRPAIAQSGPTFEIARTSLTSVHAYVASDAIPRQLAPPANIIMAGELRATVETMLRTSPTFRRQCLRIASEPGLTIDLRPTPSLWRSDVRATTYITRDPNGHLTAVVRIAPLYDTIELIAHELEHVIEQLDGIDLVATARLRGTGVRSMTDDGGMYETIRANRVGLRVSGEVCAPSLSCSR